MKKYVPSLIIFSVFAAVAVSLWLVKNNVFFLYNFLYIGSCIALGIALYANGKKYARRFVQFAVGSYMLVYLGLICGENMQIEGFWYYLFLGVFEAATIHYAVAKIFGPLVFGRGWCGYACWTAMILDLLPFSRPVHAEKKGFVRKGYIRYIVFAFSLALVAGLFAARVAGIERIMFILFIAGNAVYYAVGIALAFVFRDNRAFCKYICPVTVFMKPLSRFALIRIKCDETKCIKCGKCLKVCPMEVEANSNSKNRRGASDCILCYECVRECPVKALK